MLDRIGRVALPWVRHLESVSGLRVGETIMARLFLEPDAARATSTPSRER
jgi:hypothetical protein